MVQSNNLFNVFSKFLSFKGATSKHYSLPISNLRPACTRTSVSTDNSELNWTPSRKNSTLEPLDLYTPPHPITSRLLALSVNYYMHIYMVCTLIGLFGLVWKEKFFCILHILTRSERLIITLKEYINWPSLWKKSIGLPSIFPRAQPFRYTVFLCLYLWQDFCSQNTLGFSCCFKQEYVYCNP